MPARLSPQKQMARDRMQGVGGIILPSFAPDLSALDPAGVAFDVERAVAAGYLGVACATPGLDLKDTKAFLTIVAKAAAGRIGVEAMLERPTLEEQIDVLQHAEAVGCTQAFVLPPRSLKPASAQELYEWYVALVGDSRIPIVLYGHHNPAMLGVDPSALPVEVYDRLADLDPVAVLKLTQPIDLVSAAELCRRFGDRLVINPVNVALMPLLSTLCPIRVTADWLVESIQSKERPYLQEYVALIAAGRLDEARRVYWRFQPALKAFYALQAPMVAKGVHPWRHLKYYQWATGGNGGEMRPIGLGYPTPPLDEADRLSIQATYRSIGIEPARDDLDAYNAGRAASLIPAS